MSKMKIIAPPPSIDLLMYSLKHHAPDNSDPNTYAVCKNPFEEINASEELAKAQKVLDYDSEPDSETEDALYETQWGDADQEFGDVQSLDHEMEYSEIVDRAGVYTGEEILKVSIEKATKLHSLYCSQLSQLRQIYIERKRQYLQELKKEKELYCSIHNQKKTSLEEMRKYQQLKALMTYGRKHRLDTILAKREHEKRMASSSRTPHKSQKTHKCAFQDDGVRCINACVPLTKFCLRHILMDKRQVLFRACGAPFNNTTCNNPVLVSLKDEYCVFHSTFKSTLERERKEQEALDKAKREEIKEEIKEEEKIDVDTVEEKTETKEIVKEEGEESRVDEKDGDKKIGELENTEEMDEGDEKRDPIYGEINDMLDGQVKEVVKAQTDDVTNQDIFRTISEEIDKVIDESNNGIDQVVEESRVVEEQIESEVVVEETQVVHEEIEFEEDKVEETVLEEVVEDNIVEIE